MLIATWEFCPKVQIKHTFDEDNLTVSSIGYSAVRGSHFVWESFERDVPRKYRKPGSRERRLGRRKVGMTAAKNPRRPLGRNTLTDVATWNSSSFLSAVSTEPSASIKMLNLKLEAEVIAQYFWSCLSRLDTAVYNLTHLHEVDYGYATDAFQPTQTVLHWRRLSCNICTTKLCIN